MTLDAHRKMTMLETPGFHTEILRQEKYSHVRLLSKDQAQIQSEFIGPATSKIWNGEQAPDTAAKALDSQLNDWLKQHPQVS